MSKFYEFEVNSPDSMRRQELAQDEAWIKAFLQRADIGHIATRWGEQPFITPTTFWYDEGNHEIYFHSNISGRLRANSARYPQVCFEASHVGRLLPSNVALEFSIQYESVVAFGLIRLLEDDEDKRRALYGLIEKYFPGMEAGRHYRPIVESELKRTAVYAIAIESWSGKRNWKEKAEQSEDWQPLGNEWLD
jgi:nitroimidazol reductase NimA-like FMN-containing flavoprotein (pyridoxamine 5'-phosphate oxidase superfamily)